MPAIPATWEAEIGRMALLVGPCKKVYKTSSQQKKLGKMVHACHSSYGRKPPIGGMWFKTTWP
jgi:hypothetical protein